MAYPTDNPMDGRGAPPCAPPVWSGSPETFAAGVANALQLLEDSRLSLVECNSTLQLDAEGEAQPIPGTLDPELADLVAEHDAAIDFLRALLPNGRAA